MSKNPGLAKLGEAMKAWFAVFLDEGPPGSVFSRSGWSGQGADGDLDIARILHGGVWNRPNSEGDSKDAGAAKDI